MNTIKKRSYFTIHLAHSQLKLTWPGELNKTKFLTLQYIHFIIHCLMSPQYVRPSLTKIGIKYKHYRFLWTEQLSLTTGKHKTVIYCTFGNVNVIRFNTVQNSRTHAHALYTMTNTWSALFRTTLVGSFYTALYQSVNLE